MSDHTFNTPPELLDKIRLLDPKGMIGLDPCSNRHSVVRAKTEYGDVFEGGGYTFIDGLMMPWRGHGLVFMNPPHSMSPHNIEPWIEKAYTEFIDPGLYPLHDDQFVGLIPAKPDTGWFHEFATGFNTLCFLRGRPKFWLNGAPMPGPGKFASMLIYAGEKSEQFKGIFGNMGWIA